MIKPEKKKIIQHRDYVLVFTLFFCLLGCSPVPNENPPRSSFPSVAVEKENIYIAWQYAKKMSFQIYLKRSIDNGRTWSKMARVSSGGGNCIYPDVEVDKANVYLVWSQSRRGSSHDIMFIKSGSRGKAWSKPRRLTSPKGICEEPKIAVEKNHLYVIYEDEREGECQPYFMKSDDRGRTWTKEVNLCPTKQPSNEPDIAVENGIVYVSWHEKVAGLYCIFFRKSEDGGVTWDQAVRLTSAAADSYYPSIAVSGGILHLVWHDLRHGDAEIYYKRSLDRGDNWEEDERLTMAKRQSFNPDIIASGNNVLVSWEDLRSGYYQIYAKRSENQGDLWGEDRRLIHTKNGAGYTEIAGWPSNVYLVWTDTRDGTDQIYFKRSQDLGKTWSKDIQITK